MKHPTSILGVEFSSESFQEVLHRMNEACQEGPQIMIVTPNPEICLIAHRDPEYRNMLNQADLSLPDGIGILWASRKLNPGSPLPQRITGTDVMKAFCEAYPNRKVYLLGAREEVNRELSKKLSRDYGTRVVGNFSGSPSEEEEEDILQRIRESGAEVLFVAFGAPAQERWIRKNRGKMPGIKVMMGVGGAFDFLTGAKRRAPRWMQRSGIEWLFRLMIEPRRWKRILNATVVFPWKVYRSR